ncbi:MAG: fructose bisphosphate aldolase [Candidatus Nanopelagicales bacterium]
MNPDQLDRMREGTGFIAALDQSGGSTPHALELYGVDPASYSTESEMFQLMHSFRTRIISSPSFSSAHILGAILFKQTMENTVDGVLTADYLWDQKHVVPFLKIDNGLAEMSNGVQVMKPMPQLAELLDSANHHRVFGTKMRSLIHDADVGGVDRIVEQQFQIALEVCSKGLVPIIEPEIAIHSPGKARAEGLLLEALYSQLDALDPQHNVMLKLTLPDVDDFYEVLVKHPRVVRVVALSGGYTRSEANVLLARNHGVIASFSRALTEGLRIDQTPEEFDRLLLTAVESIDEASRT